MVICDVVSHSSPFGASAATARNSNDDIRTTTTAASTPRKRLAFMFFISQLVRAMVGRRRAILAPATAACNSRGLHERALASQPNDTNERAILVQVRREKIAES